MTTVTTVSLNHTDSGGERSNNKKVLGEAGCVLQSRYESYLYTTENDEFLSRLVILGPNK